MTEIILRRARTADIPALVRLRQIYLAECSPSSNPEYGSSVEADLEEFFCRRFACQDMIIWLAEDGGAGVATGRVRFHGKTPVHLDASICNIFVLPEYRGRGLATRIMENLVEDARRMNAGWIILEGANYPGLFRKFGFKQPSLQLKHTL